MVKSYCLIPFDANSFNRNFTGNSFPVPLKDMPTTMFTDDSLMQEALTDMIRKHPGKEIMIFRCESVYYAQPVSFTKKVWNAKGELVVAEDKKV